MEFRLWEIDRTTPFGKKLDDLIVVQANNEREILHYACMYRQDGPVKIEVKTESGWSDYSHTQPKDNPND